MVRPVCFRMNEETAVNNYYQKIIDGLGPELAQQRALREFDAFVKELQSNGISVTVIDDTKDPETPDSIFPNNWISFHHNGTVALYPMFAANRRKERRDDIFDILEAASFRVDRVKDFTVFEGQNKFLEGTGSMILDRDNHIVYAALSDRTNIDVLDNFCEEFSYQPVTFTANHTVNNKRMPIYHTNVMMCLTSKLAVVCLKSIDNQHERAKVVATLEKTGKKIIAISEEQVNQFAGNMLEVHNHKGAYFIVMSAAARQSLTAEQVAMIEEHYSIISSSLDTIEALGGGSARCMMAEVFLPKK